MNKKITLKGILGNLDAIITGATLTCCVVLVNLNVIMRYIFNAPFQWSEELVTSLFVWTVFIGSAYAYRKHSHLGVDIVVNLMRGKTKATVLMIVAVLELLVLIMLTYVSGEYAFHLLFNPAGKFKPVLTDVLRIPKFYTGVAVPIGFGVSVIYSIYFMFTEKIPQFKALMSGKDIAVDNNEEGGNAT